MRNNETPLLLWVCAAICAHYLFAEGGQVVADAHQDAVAIYRLAARVRDRVRLGEGTIEVTSLDEKPKEDEPRKGQDDALIVKQKDPEKTPPKPTPEAKKAEPKKPAVKEVVVVPDPSKPAPPPVPVLDDRIAVKQHVKTPQADNPNARFLGEQANQVEEESVATQTSHDQDDPNPTPGGSHAGPQNEVGDSDQTKIAESDEHRGEKQRAPGEKGTEFEVQPLPPAERPMAPRPLEGPKSASTPTTGGDGRKASAPVPAPPSPAPPEGAESRSPDPANAAGNWSFNPLRPGAVVGNSEGSTQTKPSPTKPTAGPMLGLGGKAGPGQVNLNLSHEGVVAAVGLDQLRKEREADGERRLSRHRGSWQSSSLERWRNAIENYVSSVKPGNQTALNTAASPFATYLVSMHNRIHPIFADSFLASLDSLPSTHPLNDQHLITRLEIVLTKDGHLTKMGIVKTSGITAFDVAALDSVQRASPFGPAPSAILSRDGNVYLHWEFHRNEVYACTTGNARPYLLTVPPAAPPADPGRGPSTPSPPSGPRERGIPPVNTSDTREGFLMQVRRFFFG